MTYSFINQSDLIEWLYCVTHVFLCSYLLMIKLKCYRLSSAISSSDMKTVNKNILILQFFFAYLGKYAYSDATTVFMN